MAHATVRRRRRDGLTEIVPNTVPLSRGERYAVSFGVLLASGGLFVSGLIPAQQLAVILGCCVTAEVSVLLRDAGVLQPPKAPVQALDRGWGLRGRPGRG